MNLGNGLELERVISTKQNDQNNSCRGKMVTTTFTLRCRPSTAAESWAKSLIGPKRINSFIDECLDLYNAEVRAKIDASRYMFTPTLTPPPSGDGEKAKAAAASGANTMLYKKYKLSDARSFDSFFHPEKASILNLVDQFQQKQGKFAIQGYPQKLGFLLHGPPGTGKTSFIKALAQYTKRHIVNIPLSKIKTNADLQAIMFDQRVLIAGGEAGASSPLPHNRVIFILEDVDAASSVVQRRDGQAPKQLDDKTKAQNEANLAAAETVMLAAALKASMAESKAESKADPSGSDSVKDGSKDGSIDLVEAGNDGPTASVASGGGVGGDSAPFSDEIDFCGPVSLKTLLGGKEDTTDKLNLASLLNVLDGVVDTPERIVIMTTNHPEKLDPALIRPGRINRKVFLGNVKLNEAKMMVRHYFTAGKPLDAKIEAELTSIFVDGVLSPATIEAMCAEQESIEDMIHALSSAIKAASEV